MPAMTRRRNTYRSKHNARLVPFMLGLVLLAGAAWLVIGAVSSATERFACEATVTEACE
jgi:hypothetical protein